MGDYVYPSIFLSYFLFFIFLAGGIFFFARSFHDGYWGSKGEDPKYRIFEDEDPSPKPEGRKLAAGDSALGTATRERFDPEGVA